MCKNIGQGERLLAVCFCQRRLYQNTRKWTCSLNPQLLMELHRPSFQQNRTNDIDKQPKSFMDIGYIDLQPKGR